jgi:hypothetical protein
MPTTPCTNACGRNGLLADQIREPTTRIGTADSPMESDVPVKMVVRAVTVR